MNDLCTFSRASLSLALKWLCNTAQYSSVVLTRVLYRCSLDSGSLKHCFMSPTVLFERDIGKSVCSAKLKESEYRTPRSFIELVASMVSVPERMASLGREQFK